MQKGANIIQSQVRFQVAQGLEALHVCVLALLALECQHAHRKLCKRQVGSRNHTHFLQKMHIFDESSY